ncbi:MAG TPA: response regulator transcription factor [Solirubrobacteraceae bacterium]|nr:response regulator transcription factor [Solirubrobacteraceae bacterium]
MTVQVAIVDDHELVRAGFRVIIDEQEDMRVVGEAADGLRALALIDETAPDVVLMDIRMPNLDGLEATRRLTEQPPHPRIVILTTFDLDEYVYGAIAMGASGFLLKDVPSSELVSAIRVVAGGTALIAPAATRRLIEQFGTAKPYGAAAARLDALSARELEVLRLVSQGLSNAEIAQQMFLGESTVKTHIGSLLDKLGVRDRVQLTIYAYEAGLTRAGELDLRSLPTERRSPSTTPAEPDGPA